MSKLNEILIDDIAYSGPPSIGGGAGSPEQLPHQRIVNQFTPGQLDTPQYVGSPELDRVRASGDSPNNMTASTPQMSDGPDISKAKSRLQANHLGGEPRNKYITEPDGVTLGATHSESFTGTGAIAIAPIGYTVVDDEEEDTDESPETNQESVMTNRRVLREWEDAKHVRTLTHSNETGGTTIINNRGQTVKIHWDEGAGESIVEYPDGRTENIPTTIAHPLNDMLDRLFSQGGEMTAMSTDDEQNWESMRGMQENKRRRGRVLREWEPEFAGGDYKAGDYQMPSPTGQGVADRKPKKMEIGSYETGTKHIGKEWPRKHKETAAMCDVDENGVEGKPQGGHVSKHSEASDGYQEKVGHNWPDQPKNDGSGVAEPFDGTRWSDGGVLSGKAPSEFGARQGSPGMPKEGPITGTSGPQLGQPSESWDPRAIGGMIGEDYDLQGLFDIYARSTEVVCLEDFKTLMKAHGLTPTIDESSMLKLMKANAEFIFYEGEDANGIYWTGQPIREEYTEKGEWVKPWEKDKDKDEGGDKEDSECDDGEHCGETCTEGKSSRPFGRTLTELQERDPKTEVTAHRRFGDGNAPDSDTGIKYGDEDDVEGTDDLPPLPGVEGSGEFGGEEAGPGPFGQHNAPWNECPECGYLGPEEACPECGMTIGGNPEENLESRPMSDYTPGMIDALDDYGGEESLNTNLGAPVMDWQPDAENEPGLVGHPYSDPIDRPGYYNRRPKPNNPFRPGGSSSIQGDYMEGKILTPQMHKALNEFMQSARSIISNNHGASRKSIGEALNASWGHYAGGIDPQQTPAKVFESLKKLAATFPGFLSEASSDVMGAASGTSIAKGGGGPADINVDDQPSKFKEMGEPLGKEQKNNLEGTPVISGTEKGMTGNSTVKENVARLAKHVKLSIAEGAKNLKHLGKYGTFFTCLVRESNAVNRTGRRVQLAEALADVEELLQVHPTENVVLEAYFHNGKNIVSKHNIMMIPVKHRQPIVGDDSSVLFRFARHAEGFAEEMVKKGHSCRLMEHNWGSAVKVLSERRTRR